MSVEVVETAVQRLVSAGLATPERLVGCTPEQLAELEHMAGGPLPAAYRVFLHRMGQSAGDFMRGTDFLYPTLLGLRKGAEALLQECGCTWQLAVTSFVFASHQGYQFLFFDRAAGDDPPVQYYLEAEPSAREVFASCSAWLTSCVADELEGK